MPPGPERNEALKLAGQLRSTADAVFPRRVGRESKRHSGCLGSIARRRYAGGSVLTRVEMVALIRASFTIGNHFVWGSHGCASRDKHRVLRRDCVQSNGLAQARLGENAGAVDPA